MSFDPYLSSIVWEMFLMRSKLISFVIDSVLRRIDELSLVVTQGIWKADTLAIIGGRQQVLAETSGEKIFDYYQEDNRMQTASQTNEFQDTPLLIAISFRCFKTSEIKSTISSLILI